MLGLGLGLGLGFGLGLRLRLELGLGLGYELGQNWQPKSRRNVLMPLMSGYILN